MTTARHPNSLAAPAAAPVVDDVTALLPSRTALLDRLAERLPSSHTEPGTLFVIGLLRRDDPSPVAQSTVALVLEPEPGADAEETDLLGRSLRRELRSLDVDDARTTWRSPRSPAPRTPTPAGPRGWRTRRCTGWRDRRWSRSTAS